MVCLITTVLAIILFIFAKKTAITINKALRLVQNHLNDVAHGNFSTIDTLSGFSEFDALICDINEMARQLEDHQKKLQLLSFVIENSNDFIIIASMLSNTVVFIRQLLMLTVKKNPAYYSKRQRKRV